MRNGLWCRGGKGQLVRSVSSRDRWRQTKRIRKWWLRLTWVEWIHRIREGRRCRHIGRNRTGRSSHLGNSSRLASPTPPTCANLPWKTSTYQTYKNRSNHPSFNPSSSKILRNRHIERETATPWATHRAIPLSFRGLPSSTALPVPWPYKPIAINFERSH